jgi:hypothetical protein
MALPTVQDARNYLRVDWTTEDPLFTSLLARARGSIEALLGYSMTAVPVTYVDYGREAASEIQLPGPFLTAGPAPVVTDVNGTVVDATTYILDNRIGKIRSRFGGSIFSAGPYTVVATIGLSAHPDYAQLEAVATTAILDLVAHLYEQRNPSEGLLVETANVAIPPRIMGDLLLLPCTRGLVVA